MYVYMYSFIIFPSIRYGMSPAILSHFVFFIMNAYEHSLKFKIIYTVYIYFLERNREEKMRHSFLYCFPSGIPFALEYILYRTKVAAFDSAF